MNQSPRPISTAAAAKIARRRPSASGRTLGGLFALVEPDEALRPVDLPVEGAASLTVAVGLLLCFATDDPLGG